MNFSKRKANEVDLDELFADVPIPDKNMYISDEEKATELISELIKNETVSSSYIRENIERQFKDLFALFSQVSLDGELELYEHFMELCSRLSETNKIRRIKDKVVVSLGGKVSAGKSNFINAISGIGKMLPVSQKTTTAIPTYVIKAEKDKISANSIYGYSTKISADALEAMAHEFDEVYGIGFSSFIDNIIFESEKYELRKEIALLDTPGYTKFDEDQKSKTVLSDRQRAFKQLSISDYLIWLIDIENGAVTQDDLEFIQDLRIKTPILIVFTKADLKSSKQIEEILSYARETIKKTSINCFGVTAYSSVDCKEYGGDHIHRFLNHTIQAGVRNNDIMAEFIKAEQDMRDRIVHAKNQSNDRAKSLFSYIAVSEKILGVQSLVSLWGESNQESYHLSVLLKEYDKSIELINTSIRKLLSEGE